MEVVVAVAAGAETKAEVPLKQLLADIWKTLLASLGAFLRWSLTSALHFPSAGESCLMPFSISDNEMKITAMQHQSGLILHLKRDMEGTGKKSLQINLTENASALSIPLFFYPVYHECTSVPCGIYLLFALCRQQSLALLLILKKKLECE